MTLRRAALVGLLGCVILYIEANRRGANTGQIGSDVRLFDFLSTPGPYRGANLLAAPAISRRNLSVPIDQEPSAWRLHGRAIDSRLARQFGGDPTPPSTTATLTGPAGKNGWYIGPVQVTLNVSDRNGAVAKTSYTVDSGAVRSYSAPFTISQNGRHHVTYFSTDTTGNDEPVQNLDVKIDSVPPSVTVSATPSSLWPPNNQIVTVTVRGMLADVVPGSGLDRAGARFMVMDTYSQVQPSGTVAVGTGGSYTVTVLLLAWRNEGDRSGRTYTIVVTASDLAGNEGVGSTSVRVPHDQRAAARDVPFTSPASSTLLYRKPISLRQGTDPQRFRVFR